MATADDTQLLKLAAFQPQVLFPSLHRVTVWTPILTLLVVLPGLYSLVHWSVDENSAGWGLKGLDMFEDIRRSNFREFSDGLTSQAGNSLAPLELAVTAVVVGLAGPHVPQSPVVVSFVSIAILLVMVFLLCRKLSGPQFAFWVVILLCCHRSTLEQMRDPSGNSLAVLLATTSFWAFVSHLHNSGRLASILLLVSGVAWGLCLMGGGPLGIAGLAVLLLFSCTHWRKCFERNSAFSVRAPHGCSGWRLTAAIAIVLITAVAVSGWWFSVLWTQQEFAFLDSWLPGTFEGERVATIEISRVFTSEFWQNVAIEFTKMLGLLSVISIYGIGSVVGDLFASKSGNRNTGYRFLLVWFATAFVVWLFVLRIPTAPSSVVRMWQTFLLIPCIAFAAITLDKVIRREIPPAVGIGLMLATVALCSGSSLQGLVHWLSFGQSVLLAVVMVVVGLLVTRWLDGWCRDRDRRQRLMLTLFVVACVIGNAWAGLGSANLQSQNDFELAQFRKSLVPVANAQRCVLISDLDEVPDCLQFLLRVNRSHVALETAESWEGALSKLSADTQPGWNISLVIDWNRVPTRPESTALKGVNIQQIHAGFFEGRELDAFLFTAEEQPKP